MRLKRKQIIQKEKEEKKQNSIWPWIRLIVISVLVGLCITMFIKPVLIQGASMYPTVNPNDYIITSRAPYVMGEPQAGDIVVFVSNLHTIGGDEKDLIKRVIAVPGDTIEVSGGKVYINDEELTEEYVIGGVTPGEVPKTSIEEGHIFVMGDNRPSSTDSRDENIGQVAMSDIKGKVIVRLFPFDKIGAVK